MNLDEQPNKQSKSSWQHTFKRLAARALGGLGEQLWIKYHAQFTADYRTSISPRHALSDVLQLERFSTSKNLKMSLVKPQAGHQNYRLNFYSIREHYLDEFIPVLENMNLRVIDQVQFIFTIDGIPVAIKSFTIKTAQSQCAPFSRLRKRLLDTIQAIMDERVENDALNKLCILTGMSWQEIDVLRAYRNYFLQLGHRTTQTSFHRALINNPLIALDLFNYFEARFKPDPEWEDPLTREEHALFPVRLQLQAGIDSVSDINDDRILRTIFNLIDATVRSNFYQRCFSQDYFIALKINSLGVIDMPSPKPQWEIYVHAPDMEGIHLRAGNVSRGGIRWSDRPDDFRTEILDLMQTQVNKNALIIPTGAKGGFVVKSNGSVKQDFKEAGKQAYIHLMRGLLDLTDNYQDGAITNPQGLVIYDDTDPYLVVAADKGTAKFSDLANAIAAEYHFWLDDAFASGGTRGYDHKELGITARGAWECVKRHFREMGKDIQQETFTVVGIGSMDGDVFGNGMLLSPCIRLMAAFSGQHIFIDPDPPDSEAALNERKRLFELPGSTWNDYDRSLISEGGGVYLRSAKDIPVNKELKQWLGIRYKSIDGESLIRYLLTTPIELLWLGGIGSYVKASTEKHEEVGDRSNDSVRIDACNLGAKVVGEGANLGFTQKARIEYNLKGGRINTDAVDNSAGVDTSDHEVNLKILLTGLQKKHLIADYQSLFMDMTDAVCQSVIADNIGQSLSLSLDQLRCEVDPAIFLQVAERLEAAGFLDRSVESFAANKEIQSRPGQLITRPELADLMAASKRYLTHQLQNLNEVLQDNCYDNYLQSYFPKQISALFKDHLAEHPLAGQIKATVISNKIINQAGCSFLGFNGNGENGNIMKLVDCYLAYEQILGADELRNEIIALGNAIEAKSQYPLFIQIEKTLAEFYYWSITHGQIIRPEANVVNQYRQYLSAYRDYINAAPTEYIQEQIDQYHQVGIPVAIAKSIVFIVNCQYFPFIVSMISETGQNFSVILELLNDVNSTLDLNEIRQKLTEMPVRDVWEKKISDDLHEDLQYLTGRLIKKILSSQTKTCAEYFEGKMEELRLKQYRRVYQEVQTEISNTLYPYVILIKTMKNLIAE